MPTSTNPLSTLSDADVLNLQIQNRNWGRDLRHNMAELVDRRMTGQISYEEYTASRRAAKDQQAQCEGRVATLSAEMRRRGMGGL
jgi:transcription elongation GreA/GreB family factor